MKLEELVAPLWFAKKLPQDMETVFVHSGDGKVRERHDVVIFMNRTDYLSAPTMQEMLPLIEEAMSHKGQGKFVLAEAFKHELCYSIGAWEYLDKILFKP